MECEKEVFRFLFNRKMKKRETKRNKKRVSGGFTLIELLLSTAIIVILTGSSLSIARFSDTQKNLTLSANQLRSLIRLAQTYALAVPFPSDKHICGFGVYFPTATTAQLFFTKATDAEFNANAASACSGHLRADGDPNNFMNALVLSVPLTSGTGISRDIFFRAPYGRIYSNNVADTGITYTLTSNSVNKNVVVNGVGKIE